MAKQNGTAPTADGRGELSAAIAEFETAKEQVVAFDAQMTALKTQREDAVARAKEAAAKLKGLLSLSGPKRAKPSGGKPPRKGEAGFGIKALKLLASDGIGYQTSTLVEEFGGTMGAAYQALYKLSKEGKLTRGMSGEWLITDAGREAAGQLG